MNRHIPIAKQLSKMYREALTGENITPTSTSLSEYICERYLGIDLNEEQVDETSMNRLASSVAKVAAIKTQDSPTNIAWAHSGLENKTCTYPPETTYLNNPNREDAKRKRRTLQKFLADRKTNNEDQNKSSSTNPNKHPGYAIIKKTASEVQNGDKNAIVVTKDGRTVNNSTQYWKFRNHPNIPIRGKEMDSIVDRVHDDNDDT